MKDKVNKEKTVKAKTAKTTTAKSKASATKVKAVKEEAVKVEPVKEKKNYSLIIGIALCGLLFVVLSWFIPTATIAEGAIKANSTNPVGLFGLIYFPVFTLDAFSKVGFTILAIGGLYGVMAKTGVYSKLVEGMVKKFKQNSKAFLIGTIITFALLNSVLGVPYALLILVPLAMSIVLGLGYSKIVAVASTVGAMLIGSLASTFGYNAAGISSNMLNIDISTGVLSRFILLVLVTGLYILFVQSSSSKKEEKEKLEFVSDVKETKKNSVPMIIFFVLTVLIAIVSMYNWNALLKIDIFEKFFEDIMAIKIGEFAIVDKVLDLNYPFGYWDSYELTGLLVVSSLIIGWLYNLKLRDTFEGFVSGAKRLLKPAFYITIANVVLVYMFSSSNGDYMLTWISDKLIGTSGEFNILAVSGVSMIGSFFCNSFNYLFSVLGQVMTISYKQEFYAVIMFMTQSLHGLLMLILPTSLFLVSGLSILEVSYKEWIKYIWKFLLELLVIILVIGAILVLVV